MSRLVLTLSCLLVALSTAPTLRAQDRPDFYVLESSETGWWIATSRVLVDWPKDQPVMTGLECVLSPNRELQASRPPMEVSVSHPVESAQYRYAIRFNLPDGVLTSRAVSTLSVGGRPYQRQIVQSRIIPWFGTLPADGIVLAYGIGREMYRPSEDYPWLPLEFLIPRFLEVESIRLGISGQFEVEHGDHETRYEELSIDMDGFKEGLAWCSGQVNPPADRPVQLPAELRQRLTR